MRPTTAVRHPLFLVCGKPGSGKSTYARRLAAEQRAALLDLDTVSERLVQVGMIGYGLHPDDRDSARYKELYRQAVHDSLFSIADENLAHVPVIIVAPFSRELKQAGFLRAVQDQLKTEVVVHWIYCNPDERRRRIEQRNNPKDTQKLLNWEQFSSESDDQRPPFDHVWVNTSGVGSVE